MEEAESQADPSHSSMYLERAEVLRKLLTPPDWEVGDPPVSPAMAMKLYEEACVKAEAEFEIFRTEMDEALITEDQKLLRSHKTAELAMQNELNAFILKERCMIYADYEENLRSERASGEEVLKTSSNLPSSNATIPHSNSDEELQYLGSRTLISEPPIPQLASMQGAAQQPQNKPRALLPKVLSSQKPNPQSGPRTIPSRVHQYMTPYPQNDPRAMLPGGFPNMTPHPPNDPRTGRPWVLPNSNPYQPNNPRSGRPWALPNTNLYPPKDPRTGRPWVPPNTNPYPQRDHRPVPLGVLPHMMQYPQNNPWAIPPGYLPKVIHNYQNDPRAVIPGIIPPVAPYPAGDWLPDVPANTTHRPDVGSEAPPPTQPASTAPNRQPRAPRKYHIT